MEKNYYDILEVNINASPEIIEKAYKTLAKKYHPDLQEGQLKSKYEEKLKLINEAYETLSDIQKKSEYDKNLKQKESSQPVENTHNINYDSNNIYENINYKKEYNKRINKAINKAYHDAYIQDLKNRGYKIKYKKTFKEYVKDLISLIIFIAILFALWQIPVVKNFFINMYNENPILRFIVDLFIDLFKSFT